MVAWTIFDPLGAMCGASSRLSAKCASRSIQTRLILIAAASVGLFWLLARIALAVGRWVATGFRQQA
jgi:hypothetical protein